MKRWIKWMKYSLTDNDSAKFKICILHNNKNMFLLNIRPRQRGQLWLQWQWGAGSGELWLVDTHSTDSWLVRSGPSTAWWCSAAPAWARRPSCRSSSTTPSSRCTRWAVIGGEGHVTAVLTSDWSSGDSGRDVSRRVRRGRLWPRAQHTGHRRRLCWPGAEHNHVVWYIILTHLPRIL